MRVMPLGLVHAIVWLNKVNMIHINVPRRDWHGRLRMGSLIGLLYRSESMQVRKL